MEALVALLRRAGGERSRMSRPTRNPAADLRGATRLVVEATEGVAGIVEDMQGPTLGIAGLVHRGIRGVTRLVGGGVDALLAPFVPLLGETRSRPAMEAALAVLNGVVGDHLAATGNPLAIPMRLRRDGVPLELRRAAWRAAIPGAAGKILVLVHGSCMNDLLWNRHGHDHGAALARDLGYTAVYLHYDSGLHVSDERARAGRAARAARRGVAGRGSRSSPSSPTAWAGSCPGAPATRRRRPGTRWPRRLRKMVFLGTPHHGAPAERLGNWVNVVLGAAPFTGPLARLPRIRSAGVTDLRHGNLLDEDWQGRDRFGPGPDRRRPVPLPRGVKCLAVAASASKGPGRPAPGRRARPRGQRAGTPRRPGADARPSALGALRRLRCGPPRPARPAGRLRARPGLDARRPRQAGGVTSSRDILPGRCETSPEEPP